MKLGSAAVLLLSVVLAAGERQRFCYKRVGYTRKHAERTSQHQQQGTASEDACHGAGCQHATRYKTEVVFRTERHCCAGYQRAGHSVDACLPICSRGCPQGEECTAPNRCECLQGHQRDSAGRCVAVAGDEPRTLPARVLSYVASFLGLPGWSSPAPATPRSFAATPRARCPSPARLDRSWCLSLWADTVSPLSDVTALTSLASALPLPRRDVISVTAVASTAMSSLRHHSPAHHRLESSSRHFVPTTSTVE